MSNSSLDLFLAACGLSEPARLIVGSADPMETIDRRIRFPGPFAVLGSHPSADSTFAMPGVARRHYYFQVIGKKVLSVDLTGASAENPCRVHELSNWLAPAADLQIGRDATTLAFEAQRATYCSGLETDGTLPRDPMPLRSQVLEFRSSDQTGRWRMKRSVALLGNGPGCSARLDCHSVSLFHCSLVLTRTGLWVLDLLGDIDSPLHQGIRINGERARFARLDEGDILQVGRFQVRILVEELRKSQRVTLGSLRALTTVDPIEKSTAAQVQHWVHSVSLRNGIESVRALPAGATPGLGLPFRERARQILGSAHQQRQSQSAKLGSSSNSQAAAGDITLPRRLGHVLPSSAISVSAWMPPVEA